MRQGIREHRTARAGRARIHRAIHRDRPASPPHWRRELRRKECAAFMPRASLASRQRQQGGCGQGGEGRAAQEGGARTRRHPTGCRRSRWPAAGATPPTRLNRPKAVPRSVAGADSATRAASRPWVSPMCRSPQQQAQGQPGQAIHAGRARSASTSTASPAASSRAWLHAVGQHAHGIGRQGIDEIHRHQHQRDQRQRQMQLLRAQHQEGLAEARQVNTAEAATTHQ